VKGEDHEPEQRLTINRRVPRKYQLGGQESNNYVFVTGAKMGWHFAWETMMKELAPQTKDGSYARPTYNLKGVIGSPEFPV
jgi:hypothetical protein